MKSPGSRRTGVLFVTGSLRAGGAEGQVSEMVRRLDRARFDPDLFLLTRTGGGVRTVVEAGVPVYDGGFERHSQSPVDSSTYRLLRTIMRISTVVRRGRYDIVHTFLHWADVLGVLGGRLGGAGTIVTSRRSLLAGRVRERFVDKLGEKVVRRGGDWVICNSEAVRQEAIGRELLRPERALLVRNGVDLGRFDGPFDRQVARATLGVLRESRVVAMVANLIHYKGHAHVLRAFGELLPRYPTLTLLLAGEGPEERRLRDLASALGLGSQVIFLGSHPDVPGLLRASDISLLYSDQEGFSNAILESMAAGLPVVASNVGGNPEAVADGVTGVIVPAAQPQALATALRPLLDNPTLATTMGARGRERAAREFSMPAMIRNLERAYETVLAERAE